MSFQSADHVSGVRDYDLALPHADRGGEQARRSSTTSLSGARAGAADFEPDAIGLDVRRALLSTAGTPPEKR